MPWQLGTGAFLQKSHGVQFSWNSSWVWKENWPRGGQARRDSPLAANPYDKVKSNFGAVSTTAGGTCQEARCCCWKTVFHKVWACDVHLSPMCGPGHGALLLDKITKAGRGGNCMHTGGLTYKVKADNRKWKSCSYNLPALSGIRTLYIPLSKGFVYLEGDLTSNIF